MPTTTTVRSSRAGQARTRNTNALPSVGVGYRRVPRTARTLKKNGLRPDLRVRSEASKPPLRLIQHKHEAWWFYRYLSQVYDHIVNPGHWTESMREDALKPARLNEKQRVVDVGGGTGFSTTGVVAAGVKPTNITLVDQSPHQLEKARKKPQLQGCTIMEGDAENLDFPTNEFDRYVSCGSIEYWPDPQRGIAEAYRVVKPGGLACMVGPVHPTHWLSRIMADAWMLFPTEEEYIKWFTAAGFICVKMHRIGPSWYRGCRKHGLIMGCSVTGIKPLSAKGPSPLDLGEMAEKTVQKQDQPKAKAPNPLQTLRRVILGSLAGFYYFIIPVYMWLKNLVFPKHVRFQ